jgi:hypothetical protein
MTAGDVASVVTEVKVAGDTVLELVGTFDPAVELEAGVAEGALNLIAQMASKAIAAYGAAAGVPVTSENVLALLPNQAPLSEPDVAAV